MKEKSYNLKKNTFILKDFIKFSFKLETVINLLLFFKKAINKCMLNIMIKLLNKARIFSKNICKIDCAIAYRSHKTYSCFIIANCKQTFKKG